MNWKSQKFFRSTCRSTNHNEDGTASDGYYLALNSLQEILPALLLLGQLHKHSPHFYFFFNFWHKYARYKNTEQLLYFIHLFLWVFHILSFVLVGFISMSLKQCRNWLATGNSFQNNIAPWASPLWVQDQTEQPQQCKSYCYAENTFFFVFCCIP